MAANDPQLSTPEVEGPNPVRVVIDPMRRLAPDYRVFRMLWAWISQKSS